MKKLEPKVFITDENYKGVVVFNRKLGFRCGYIFISENDINFKGNNLDSYDIDVHGGLTYKVIVDDRTDYPVETRSRGIWLGFDCGHCNDGHDFDVWRSLIETENDRDIVERIDYSQGITRSEEFVMNEIKSMSKQLSKGLK